MKQKRTFNNRELREAFLSSNLDPVEVAFHAGITREGRHELKGDSGVLRRRLGLAPLYKEGYEHYTVFITDEQALAIIRAMDRDPMDFGL